MGTLKVTQVIMKVLFISAILAVASAGFAPTCDECNTAAQGLLERLTSAESIAEQTGMPLPCFHRSQRRLPAPRSLQGEERPRRLDLRRLHRHHDQSLRLHGGARYYRTGNRNPPRRVLLWSCRPHS